MRVVYCEDCGQYRYQPNKTIAIPFDSRHGLTSTWHMCNKCYAKHCGGEEALKAALAGEAKPATRQGILSWLLSMFTVDNG